MGSRSRPEEALKGRTETAHAGEVDSRQQSEYAEGKSEHAHGGGSRAGRLGAAGGAGSYMHQDEHLPRFFTNDLSPAEIALAPGEAHHAMRVLRLAPGAEVELLDGRGGSARGLIAAGGRREVVVTVGERMPAAPRPRPAFHLAFAVPKGKRLDWLLEKATELGAASLRPVVFERSVAGPQAGPLPQAKRARWLERCIAAAKQCGLNWLPAVEEPVDLPTFLAAARGKGTFAVLGSGDPSARPLAEALMLRPPGWDICLLVGPEGGLTGDERAAALAAGLLPARLGRYTLRIETAAIALLAAVTAICGEE